MKRIFLVIILAVIMHSVSFAEEFTKIIKVDAKKIGNYAEVTVTTSAKITPQILILESPNRIAMAFSNSRIDKPLTIASPSPLIRIIQAAQFDENTVYVIVEPQEELTYDYASIIGRNTVILEVTKAKPGSQKTVMPSISTSQEVQLTGRFEAPTPEAEVQPEPKEILTATVEMFVASREEAAVTQEMKAVEVSRPATKEYISKKKEAEIIKKPLPLSGRLIVIDPGHGGMDPGYVGKSGILEKALTFKIAKKLQTLLNNAGAKVLLTRYGDQSTKDRDVVALANNNKADIFVAIHLNSYTSQRTGGSETFYFTSWSKKFASIVQKNLSGTIKRRNRGIKRVTYYTVHHTKMPAVLVEAVYLTNPKEEKLILDTDFQGKVAYGIYKGIREYVKIAPYGRNIPGKKYNLGKSPAQSSRNSRAVPGN